MKITKKQLNTLIRESMEIDLEIGDVILTGKFKNKRTTVKEVGVDDNGQPTINGRPMLKFRIEKKMPQDKWSSKSKELHKKGELKESRMKITKRQLRRIIKEAMPAGGVLDVVGAVTGVRGEMNRKLRDVAEKEALRWFQSGPVGRMTRRAWVTSVRSSPVEPEFEQDVIFRVTIKTDSNDKRQIDVVLDSETAGFRGASEA